MVSDKMDVDLGKDYDLSVQQVVEELEQPGKEADLSESPSREIKEELIEREGISREGRKVGEGKVSSESAEEGDRITIEDSVWDEDYMIRTVGAENWAQGEEEPAPVGDVVTPVMESTPIKRRPMKAPKKKWVKPERTDEADNISSEEETYSERSATTERSEQKAEITDDRPPALEKSVTEGPPRRYGARSTRIRVYPLMMIMRG